MNKTNCTPRDIEVLKCHVIGKPRAFLYSHSEYQLTPAEQTQLDAFVSRRNTGEPIAYIIEKKEFYGRDFVVSPSTLIPRPETEELVEMIVSASFDLDARIHDLGTGSGCVAVTLGAERYTNITASDISEAALIVARQNAKNHNQNIVCMQSDLLESVPADVEVLVGNLPYVPLHIKEELSVDVKDFEPHLALFSGEDGSDLYRKLGIQIQQRSLVLQACFFEVDYSHAKDIVQYYQKIIPLFDWKIVQDMSSKDRFIKGKR